MGRVIEAIRRRIKKQDKKRRRAENGNRDAERDRIARENQHGLRARPGKTLSY